MQEVVSIKNTTVKKIFVTTLYIFSLNCSSDYILKHYIITITEIKQFKHTSMKLLYNLSVCQPVGNVKRHGGGIYGEIVLKRIIKRQMPVVCFYNAQKWLNPEIHTLLKEHRIPLYDSNNYTLNEVAKLCQADVLYSPMNSGLAGFNTCKVIYTIHGLRKLELPKDYFFFKYKSSLKEKWKFILKWIFSSRIRSKDYRNRESSIKNENRSFVTVSEHSKYAFLSYYPLLFKDKNIPVFYSPSTIGELHINECIYKEKFFLLVSAGLWAKNNLRAIIALDRLFSSNMLKGYNVRVTGVSDPSIYNYKIQNPDRFQFMGYVEDCVLHQLFHDAYCLIYPSLNEGFGYPPIEAMSFGVPVIASSFSSIYEVCQNAAMYLNPYSIEEIMNRVIQMTNEITHKEYSSRAINNYERVYKRQKEDLDKLIDYLFELNNGR